MMNSLPPVSVGVFNAYRLSELCVSAAPSASVITDMSVMAKVVQGLPTGNRQGR
jgi:hypothetical protein